jgi:hypothetical protein
MRNNVCESARQHSVDPASAVHFQDIARLLATAFLRHSKVGRVVPEIVVHALAMSPLQSVHEL